MTRRHKISGIYGIFLKGSGMAYVGQSIDIQGRISSHYKALIRGDHDNRKLQLDFYEQGSKMFLCGILEEIPRPGPCLGCEELKWKKRMNHCESDWLLNFLVREKTPVYNLCIPLPEHDSVKEKEHLFEACLTNGSCKLREEMRLKYPVDDDPFSQRYVENIEDNWRV